MSVNRRLGKQPDKPTNRILIQHSEKKKNYWKIIMLSVIIRVIVLLYNHIY